MSEVDCTIISVSNNEKWFSRLCGEILDLGSRFESSVMRAWELFTQTVRMTCWDFTGRIRIQLECVNVKFWTVNQMEW